eukprot:1801509-Amphidinium_carterae.1
MMTFFGVWFGGSMFSSAITKTNAFEIYVGVWECKKLHRMHENSAEFFVGVKRFGPFYQQLQFLG